MSAAFEIGWFGKLPSAGDFVFRRVPRSLQDTLDDWLSRGLAEYRVAMPDDWRKHFAAAPVWNCAIPACVGRGSTLIGLLLPSHDRVGREFPLCVGVALDGDAATHRLLADVDRWLWRLGQVVVEARDHALSLDEFDANIQSVELPGAPQSGASAEGGSDILDILGLGPIDAPTIPMPLAHAVPWPELPMIFDAETPTSYWWTNTGTSESLRGFTTEGQLEPSLLMRLMGPAGPAPSPPENGS